MNWRKTLVLDQSLIPVRS